MSKSPTDASREAGRFRRAAVEHLRDALDGGRRDWVTSLVEAVALWTAPQESYGGRQYDYFIEGEAFDWLLLAERLCQAVGERVPREEVEDLLFFGHFPAAFDASRFRDLLGVEKYRGHLNYFYGVTVEEALQLATEVELHKSGASNGVQYMDDYSEEAFQKIYGASKTDLLTAFREERNSTDRRTLGLSESKRFTYWLFKLRLKASDKARLASDTRKGLQQLERMRDARQASS